MSQGVQVPGSDGGGDTASDSIWDDIWNGFGDVVDRGFESLSKWYELEYVRDLAHLQLPPAQVVQPPPIAVPEGRMPLELTPTMMMGVAVAAIGAVLLLRSK